MLYQIWTSLTEAQATIVNGGLTVFAAGFGVLLGWYLFGGKVKNITDAIETSKHLVDDHLGGVDKRDSQGGLIVIQAGTCNGDQIGTRPDVGRGMGVS